MPISRSRVRARAPRHEANRRRRAGITGWLARFLTTWITDPDGHRIEVVQWPADHPDGITAADWPD